MIVQVCKQLSLTSVAFDVLEFKKLKINELRNHSRLPTMDIRQSVETLYLEKFAIPVDLLHTLK